MKIGILTHPQYINYGGILQCFALSSYLREKGHEPIIIQRTTYKSSIIKRIVLSIMKITGIYYLCKGRHSRDICIQPFVKKYIKRTPIIDSQQKMCKICKKYNFKAVIVGSDQVWRKSFAINYQYNYFLDFVPQNIIKASYAASFGINEWDYNEEETKRISFLLKNFDYISVREKEGKELCKRYLNVNAQVIIDPTLLLDSNYYDKYTSSRLIKDNYIFIYWLGEESEIPSILFNHQNKNLKTKIITLRGSHILESVEDWLSYIKYSDLVLTDSFHGCVFSLIFKKQFVVYCNQSGGYGRIETLFESLDLKNKLINPETPIDYSKVTLKMTLLQQQGYEYISQILASN